VTGDVGVLASGGCHIFSGCGFPAPGLQDFNWKPFFTIGSFGFTKPMLLAIVAALVVILFFWAAFRKPKLVPRGVQSLGEMAILAIRDQILRPSLGRRGDSYLPFLVSLFFFIYIILFPVELLRFFVFQPFTLGVRLFGNMFAGHLLLTIFTIASWYLLSLSVGLLYAVGSFALAIFVFLLETLVTLLQAFIFTTLTATYIASSVEPAH
jgi:F-type H+-transporting ATPase subunit a